MIPICVIGLRPACVEYLLDAAPSLLDDVVKVYRRRMNS